MDMQTFTRLKLVHNFHHMLYCIGFANVSHIKVLQKTFHRICIDFCKDFKISVFTRKFRRSCIFVNILYTKNQRIITTMHTSCIKNLQHTTNQKPVADKFFTFSKLLGKLKNASHIKHLQHFDKYFTFIPTQETFKSMNLHATFRNFTFCK